MRRHQFSHICTLVEGYADLLCWAPDDVAGNLRAVGLKNKVEKSGMSSGTWSAAPEMEMLRTSGL
jgi:hypothetical protein